MDDENLSDAVRQLLAKQDANRMAVQSLRGPQNPQTMAFYRQAFQDMGLTPQESYLYQHHLDNLIGEGKVIQPNGDISTMLQVVVTGPDGKFYNIPTVWDGKILEPDAAQKQAAKIGWDKWPAYPTPEAADARYENMHRYLERDTAAWIKNNPNYASPR